MPEVAQLLCISERLVWELVLCGELGSVRIGRRRLVSTSALDEYVQRLEAGV
ncbi:MAG TPA: helix-turn-helix domain-containing protein [Chloroflexota bacterium]|jgi:excisionase family DNA binding protein